MKRKEQIESMNPVALMARIPRGIGERLQYIESRFDRGEYAFDEKIAVFDLDNTLLIGDIGDALFTQLKIDERERRAPLTVDHQKMALTWEGFKEILEREGKEVAYPLMTTAMAGIPATTIIDATRNALRSTAGFLEAEGEEIPVPVPNPAMQALVFYLRQTHYRVFIISATNRYSVQVVAEECFGIPGSHVLAMQPAVFHHPVHGEVLTDTLVGPVTVGTGKVDAYRRAVGHTPPVIGGGDSPTDIPVLNLTDPHGLVIWVERNPHTFRIPDALIQQFSYPQNLYVLRQETDV
ncbi:MAG: HAD family hydrolase [Candidatus Omnitrophota bacterium]